MDVGFPLGRLGWTESADPNVKSQGGPANDYVESSAKTGIGVIVLIAP